MQEPLIVGLESWVIQDGNYTDFVRGTNGAFALEFSMNPAWMAADSTEPHLTHLNGPNYEVTGQVAHLGENWWVFDVGIPMYCDQRPFEGLKKGDWIYSEIQVGVDPFIYLVDFAPLEVSPALVFDWRIEKIETLTAPLVEVKPRHFERDSSQIGWREVEQTNAWEDDGGNAFYLLHCRRLDTAARRVR